MRPAWRSWDTISRRVRYSRNEPAPGQTRVPWKLDAWRRRHDLASLTSHPRSPGYGTAAGHPRRWQRSPASPSRLICSSRSGQSRSRTTCWCAGDDQTRLIEPSILQGDRVELWIQHHPGRSHEGFDEEDTRNGLGSRPFWRSSTSASGRGLAKPQAVWPTRFCRSIFFSLDLELNGRVLTAARRVDDSTFVTLTGDLVGLPLPEPPTKSSYRLSVRDWTHFLGQYWLGVPVYP